MDLCTCTVYFLTTEVIAICCVCCDLNEDKRVFAALFFFKIIHTSSACKKIALICVGPTLEKSPAVNDRRRWMCVIKGTAGGKKNNVELPLEVK